MRLSSILATAVAVSLFAGSAVGAEYHVTVEGTPDGMGTRESPWDLASALAGQQNVRSGDTIWVHGGNYRSQRAYRKDRSGFLVNLQGGEGEPVRVRAWNRERATIDGGMEVQDGCRHLWLEGLEITVTPDEEILPETETPGSHPGDLGAPLGGLNIYGGEQCKFINLVVQKNYGGGVSWWLSGGGEMYGCIIVNNGWKAPDRNHGHCIYTQNNGHTKTISNCIMTTRFGDGQYTMHAYGSARAYVNDYVIDQNMAYGEGPFLVGGGRPSRNITVRGNYLYRVPMRIGYSAPHNENCEVAGNTLFRGGLSILRYKQAKVMDNLILAAGVNTPETTGEGVTLEGNREVPGDNLPEEPDVVLLPNRYDRHRAHLVIFNYAGREQVEVDTAAFLNAGDHYRLMDPERFFGEPLHEGTCEGNSITIAMDKEFAVFVMHRQAN